MELIDQFKAMRKLKGENYKPRTKHFDENGWAKYTNRLFLESSPYLLQHAHNPVNWYPWGEKAFKTAKEKNIPVLLSVGYSTCHWCHVMEAESFEDIEIAAYMNENYICIKVDREERPDVDAVYMSAVQSITGSGGWPMSVWLTPDKKPFYGGTYFPARDGERGTFMGFFTILKKLKQAYDKTPDIITRTSTEITENLHQILSPKKIPGRETSDVGTSIGKKSVMPPSASVLEKAVTQVKAGFDEINGGMKGAPKFPSTMPIRFLLRYYNTKRDKSLLDIAEKTLLKMASGGIYDHAGGGFHRYATDEKWLVPHFEKMLYDNALLIMAYAEGFQVTGNEIFKQVAEETILYVKRDMTSPGGAFFSASDADSITDKGKREEGYYFTWTLKEIESLFGKKNAEIAARYFDITLEGNFEGRNILNIKTPAAAVAEEFGMEENEFLSVISHVKSELYKKRKERKSPIRDEKILTSWNGLMISAFAQAGRIFGNDSYISEAKKAALFILDNLYTCHGDGLDLNPPSCSNHKNRHNQACDTSHVKNFRLSRSYKDGKASNVVFLDDYAFFTAGLIDLFEADHDPFWIETAVRLEKTMSDLFEDKAEGGFFMTSIEHEKMIARAKPMFDNAIPSGNSIAVMNLLRLSQIKPGKGYKDRAFKTLAAFSSIMESSPLALSDMLLALDFITCSK